MSRQNFISSDGTHSPQFMKQMLKQQQSELTGQAIYTRIAAREKNPRNREILTQIAAGEQKHAAIWQSYTEKATQAKKGTVFLFSMLSSLFGYTFTIRLLENIEDKGIRSLKALGPAIPELESILRDEEVHEEKLLSILDEERLNYVGDIVLGLNDALVELTGALSGFVFATRSIRLVALTGIVTGISATLSMAASNFLARRAEQKADALKSSLYTGIAYLLTVVLLVLPYLLFPVTEYIAAFVTMIGLVLVIILFFNYYISVAKVIPFWSRFLEMAGISLGVAVISYLIGIAASSLLGISA